MDLSREVRIRKSKQIERIILFFDIMFIFHSLLVATSTSMTTRSSGRGTNIFDYLDIVALDFISSSIMLNF